MNPAEGVLRDVVGIGNAIVDVLTRADDSLLDDLGLAKGAMTLIDADQAGAIYGSMGPSVERSGGSVANTMAGIADLGGTGSYIGKLHDDDFGAVFRHDLSSLGIEMDGQLATEGPPTPPWPGRAPASAPCGCGPKMTSGRRCRPPPASSPARSRPCEPDPAGVSPRWRSTASPAGSTSGRP